MYRLILASESPRRKKLLEDAGFHFAIIPSKISEIPGKNLNIDEQILDIARQKARAVLDRIRAQDLDFGPLLPKNLPLLILSADTEVVQNEKTLGKPKDQSHAFKMLQGLSGQEHLVKTAICLLDENGDLCAEEIETSRVKFRILKDSEIHDYINTGEPMDKAGAYGMQGFGRGLVESFVGNEDNIIGLPIQTLEKMLRQQNWRVQRTLAVSKLQPVTKIRQLYAHGQRLFAENFVQELMEKQEQLRSLKDIEWHFIGRLQKNKVNHVVSKVKLIHSVDSLELATKINSRAKELNICQEILLQINTANESTKAGLVQENILADWAEYQKLNHVGIRGLMSMPPMVETAEDNRKYFRILYQLQEQLNLQNPKQKLDLLSMGTSQDYQIALEEGAGLVRLGTQLFGERTVK